MPEKKKKHNPGTFLDWLLDYFIKPIADKITELINNPMEIIRTVSPLSYLKNVFDLIAPYVGKVDSAISSDKVKSPADAGVAAEKMMPELDTNLSTLAEALMYIETGSAGMIDISPEHMVNLPKFRFLETIATELRVEKFRTGMLSLYRRKLLEEYLPLLPEPYRLAEMVSKGIIRDDAFTAAMGQNGFDSTWAWRWGETQVKYPDMGTAMALLRRGEIDEATFYFWMQRLQFDISDVETMLTLKDVIPPIDDLIRFAVREAFPVEAGLPQFKAMESWAGKMGLTPFWVDKYWKAHFSRMGLGQAYSNLWRGYFDIPAFEKYLLLADVHPDDWKSIEAVAFNPPSIRELGYGFDVGAYTEDDVVKFRRWGGLSEEDAKKSGKAMVAYRTEAERNAVRTEYVYAYGRGKLSILQLTVLLAKLNTPAEAIKLWIERAELYKERMQKPEMDTEGKLVSSSEALTTFKLGIRDETWVREKLKALDWASDRIDVAVERVKFDLAERAAEDAEVTIRNLTVAQIRNFFSTGIISKEQMTGELVKLKYSVEDAKVLTELYAMEPDVVVAKPKVFSSAVATNLFKMAIFNEADLYDNFLAEGYSAEHATLLTIYTVVSQAYPDVRELYRKGAISTDDMIRRFTGLGMEEDAADTLAYQIVRELQIDRVSAEKDLTKAEIIKGVKSNILTAYQGAGLLQDIGYDESEAWYILAINKVIEVGDPEGYWDMRRVTETYRKSRGEKAVDIPDELIVLERQLKEARAKVDELRKSPEREEEIKEAVLALSSIEQRMRELVTKLGIK
jgi:hypothetical protein